MREDMRRAQYAFDKVFELYGKRPDTHAVLEYQYIERRDYYRYVWGYTIPFHFEWYEYYQGVPSLYFAVHEIAHFYTRELLRVDALWLREGISIVLEHAEYARIPVVELNFSSRLTDSSCPDFNEDYKLLKDGLNIFKELTTCDWSRTVYPDGFYRYMGSSHNSGRLFFVALSLDYSINESKLVEFMRTLVELASDGRRIGMDDLRTAAMEVMDEDIAPLLKLLEPVIQLHEFRPGYPSLETIEQFFEKNPQYKTEHVSWTE